MPKVPKTLFVVALLWVAGLLAGAQFAKVSVLLPQLRAIYPTQNEEIAWLLTLVSITGAIFGGLAGTFAIRLGQRRFLVASLLAAGALSLWQSTFPAFPALMISRVAEGVTHLGIVVTAPALMAQISSDRWRGAAMALWSTFFGVSFAIFAWFGIPAADDLGASGLFQIHGICLVIVGCLAAAMVPHAPRDDAEPIGTTPPVWDRYRDPNLIWPGLGWLFYTLTFLALLTILPAQVPEDQRPQVTTAMSLVGIAVSLLILPVLLSRAKATTLVRIGFALAALLLLFGFGVSTLVLGVALFLILGVVQGGTFAAVAELNQTTDRRTLSYGFMAQTGNIGNLVGTPLLLFVLNTSGEIALNLTVAAIYGVSFFCLVLLARRIRAPQTAP